MRRISSALSTSDATFRSNTVHNRRLADELHAMQEKARHVRPERDV